MSAVASIFKYFYVALCPLMWSVELQPGPGRSFYRTFINSFLIFRLLDAKSQKLIIRIQLKKLHNNRGTLYNRVVYIFEQQLLKNYVPCLNFFLLFLVIFSLVLKHYVRTVVEHLPLLYFSWYFVLLGKLASAALHSPNSCTKQWRIVISQLLLHTNHTF